MLLSKSHPCMRSLSHDIDGAYLNAISQNSQAYQPMYPQRSLRWRKSTGQTVEFPFTQEWVTQAAALPYFHCRGLDRSP
jgi:hypothetical protein